MIQQSQFYLSKRNENRISKIYLHSYVYYNTDYSRQDMGKNCQEMNKENAVCVCVCVCVCVWWNVIQPQERRKLCHSRQHGPGGCYAKWDKTYKNKYCMISLIISKNLLPYMVKEILQIWLNWGFQDGRVSWIIQVDLKEDQIQ